MFNSPINVSYLNGAQLGLASFDINCTIANGDTLMGDTGSRFLTLSPNSDVEAMISIPTNVICQNRSMSMKGRMGEGGGDKSGKTFA
jgi:hypothetical protein